MKPPADIIRQLLIDASLGTQGPSADWSVFVSFLPGNPDDAICVYDTAGKLDGRLMEDGTQIEHPGIQVMVRGMSYLETWEKAKTIASAFDAWTVSSIAVESGESYTLYNISRSGDILPLGMEAEGDRRRLLFSINATVTVRQNE